METQHVEAAVNQAGEALRAVDAGRTATVLGAVLGFLTVALGAFAAHGLAPRLEPRLLANFRTGVEYQGIHALALLALGALLRAQGASRAGTVATVAFAVGVLVFSGSLYALALSGVRALGAVTPIGGVSFLVGWATFAWLAATR